MASARMGSNSSVHVRLKLDVRGVQRPGTEQSNADAPTGSGGQREKRKLIEPEVAEDDLCSKEDTGYRRHVGGRDAAGDSAGDSKRWLREQVRETGDCEDAPETRT